MNKHLYPPTILQASCWSSLVIEYFSVGIVGGVVGLEGRQPTAWCPRSAAGPSEGRVGGGEGEGRGLGLVPDPPGHRQHGLLVWGDLLAVPGHHQISQSVSSVLCYLAGFLYWVRDIFQASGDTGGAGEGSLYTKALSGGGGRGGSSCIFLISLGVVATCIWYFSQTS